MAYSVFLERVKKPVPCHVLQGNDRHIVEREYHEKHCTGRSGALLASAGMASAAEPIQPIAAAKPGSPAVVELAKAVFDPRLSKSALFPVTPATT